MLKLQRIFEKTVALIDNYKPDCLAIEAPFYGKKHTGNAQAGSCAGRGYGGSAVTQYRYYRVCPRKINNPSRVMAMRPKNR